MKLFLRRGRPITLTAIEDIRLPLVLSYLEPAGRNVIRRNMVGTVLLFPPGTTRPEMDKLLPGMILDFKRKLIDAIVAAEEVDDIPTRFKVGTKTKERKCATKKT